MLRGSPKPRTVTRVLAALLAVDDRRARLRTAAASLGAVVSHGDAALLWGFELVEQPVALQLTVGRNRSRASLAGCLLRRADLAASDRAVVDGIPVTAPVRTVLDLCRVLSLGHAVAAADSALRRRVVTHEQLVDAVASLPPAPGRLRCREVVSRVDAASGSVLESLGRVLFDEAGLRPFETQHPIVTAAGDMVRADVAWPQARLVVELDGFAFHADRATYRSDRRRTNALVLSGWRVLRFSWEDVVGRPEVVVAQVRAALAA